MSFIELTSQVQGQDKPVTLNPVHVAAISPGHTFVPDVASQSPHVHPVRKGTRIHMHDGSLIEVREDYDIVRAALIEHKGEPDGTVPDPTLLTQNQRMGLNLRDDTVEKEFLSNLKQAGVPVSDTPTPQLPDYDILDTLTETPRVDPQIEKTLPPEPEREPDSVNDQTGTVELPNAVITPPPAKKAPAKKAAKPEQTPRRGDEDDDELSQAPALEHTEEPSGKATEFDDTTDYPSM
jgi:hypothetical protein